MSAKMFGRPAAMTLLILGLGVSLLWLANPAHTQLPPSKKGPAEKPEPASTTSAAQLSGVKLANDVKMSQFIDSARDNIAVNDWDKVVALLQEKILDKEGAFYVQVRGKDANGRETVRWTSVSFEANNLMSKLPPEGLDVYENKYGPDARAMLNEAKKKGDRDLVAKVAQRYMYTKAGIEANDLLATFFLDRGQYFLAGLRLEKILELPEDRTRLSDMTLFKAALAYNRSGDKKRFEEVWNRLTPRLEARGGLKVGDEVVPVAKLMQIFNGVRQTLVNPHDWLMVRGNVTNSAQAQGGQPALDYPLFPPRSTISDGEEKNRAMGMVNHAIARQQALDKPVLSGFFPIVANNMVIFRTQKDIHAIALAPIKDSKGRDFQPGDTVWRAAAWNSLVETMESTTKYAPVLTQFWNQFDTIPGYPAFIYENSLLGSISCDNRLVYMVDDLAIPAAPNILQVLNSREAANLKPRILENVLSAFETSTGRRKWYLGAYGSNDPDQSEDLDNQFANSHFLSTPIAVGGKLYVLNEKHNGLYGDAKLRLVCIDPDPLKVNKHGRPQVLMGADGEPGQHLGTVPQHARFTHDPARRTNSAFMAYGEGIIVCTTNAGEVLGVDVLSRGLAWSYPYREPSPHVTIIPPPGPPGFGPRPANMQLTLTPPLWKSSPPVIYDGKVVFTAPDAASIHCINLRDGTPAWKKKHQDGDLFLAGVFSGKVLIVGRDNVRVLDLADGKEIWREPIRGVPSGQGVASKNVYFLPVKKSFPDKKSEMSEIVAFDLDRLAVKSRNQALTSTEDLGNLVFSNGVVLSQSPRSIVAFYELKHQLDLANKEVSANPTGLSLFKRGKWLLADGQIQPAVTDFHKALKHELPPNVKEEARRKFFQALTEYMLINFKDASAQYLDDYREICNVPGNADEEQERLAKYYRVVGQGYDLAEEPLRAFQMYRQFGALSNIRSASVDDANHSVPTNVWLRGRIAGMMLRIPDDKKKELNDKIAQEWQEVKAKRNLDAMRTFVDMFDVPLAVGREARLHLAETIVERDDRQAFLEAEMNLQQLRGSQYFIDEVVSARALAALAKLEEKKAVDSRAVIDTMKLAAMYYRELRRNYANVVLADGKTGAQLCEELKTDPRYLHLLEEPGPFWNAEVMRSRETNDVRPGQTGFVFQPEGDMTPLIRQTRLLLETTGRPKLHCYNFASNSTRWTLELDAHSYNPQVFQPLYANNQRAKYNPDARFRFYQVCGNLAVVQVGVVAYCVDMDAGRILWQQDLFEPPASNMSWREPRIDAEGNFDFVFESAGRASYTRLGHVGAVRASYVALMTPKGLLVVDPLRHRIDPAGVRRPVPLWRKTDVSLTSRVFGDDQYIFTVDMAEGNAGTGRGFRAIDGMNMNVSDFGDLYQHRLRVIGRKLLVAMPGKTLKLYDIATGKTQWSKTFHAKSAVLATEDPGLTGVIEPTGLASVLDVQTGEILLQANFTQPQVSADGVVNRVSLEDVANLEEPVLLHDKERFYFALNQPIGPKVRDGVIYNNFAGYVRCRQVNGWVVAYFREDGQHLNNGKLVKHKKGDFDWRSPAKMENQLVVVEQFESLPVMIFSARYSPVEDNLPFVNPGFNPTPVPRSWLSFTKALNRSTGKWLYTSSRGDIHVKPSQETAVFGTFVIETKDGTINLVADDNQVVQRSVQFYMDGGRTGALGAGAGGPNRHDPVLLGENPGLQAIGVAGLIAEFGEFNKRNRTSSLATMPR